MKVSVAMATYNGADYIREQLESIISQSILPDEIIISDDHSKDGTINIVNEFFNEHKDIGITVSIVLNETGLNGPTKNFENAIRLTTGDVIILCDQDDIWKHNKVERMVEVMKNHSENVVFHDAEFYVQQNSDVFKSEGDTVFHKKNNLSEKQFEKDGTVKVTKDEFFWLSYQWNLINGMCMCIRRDYLLSLLPFSEGCLHDAWICFCAIVDDSLLAVNDVLALYRVHSKNTTSPPGKKVKKNFRKSFLTYSERTKTTIKELYLKHADMLNYAGKDLLHFERFHKRYDFYCVKRIEILGENMFLAAVNLYKEYRKDSYELVGKRLFFHDLLYCLSYSKKERVNYISTIPGRIRKKSN